MAKHNFRAEASEACERARHLLDNEITLSHLRYAALEIRMAMEALTYERAQSYEDQLPKNVYGTWQPRKLMQLLLDINPDADQGGTIRIDPQSAPDAPATEFIEMGTETALTMADLKRHYDAIGSYLHMPTVTQLVSANRDDEARLRKRLKELVAIVEKVLASTLWNFTWGNHSSFECRRCQQTIRKRLKTDADEMDVVCRECGAPYKLKREDDGILWYPQMAKVECSGARCGSVHWLWDDEITINRSWRCEGCDRTHLVTLMSVALPRQADEKMYTIDRLFGAYRIDEKLT
jgi:hypothetical protein